MFRPCEYGDETSEHQLKPALRILWRKSRDGRLLSDDELQFGDEFRNQQAVRSQRFKQCVPPSAEFCFGLAEQSADQALKRLRQRGVWNVTFVLVKLAGGKKAARRHEHLVQLMDDGRFADAGIS